MILRNVQCDAGAAQVHTQGRLARLKDLRTAADRRLGRTRRGQHQGARPLANGTQSGQHPHFPFVKERVKCLSRRSNVFDVCGGSFTDGG